MKMLTLREVDQMKLTWNEANFLRFAIGLKSNHAALKGCKRMARLTRDKFIILRRKLEDIQTGMIYIINKLVWFII